MDIVSVKFLYPHRELFVNSEAEWRIYASVNNPSLDIDNGLSPGRRQAIILTNAGILLIGPLGTKFNEFFIEIHTFLFKEMHLKMSSGKWRPFCLGLNVFSPTPMENNAYDYISMHVLIILMFIMRTLSGIFYPNFDLFFIFLFFRIASLIFFSIASWLL